MKIQDFYLSADDIKMRNFHFRGKFFTQILYFYNVLYLSSGFDGEVKILNFYVEQFSLKITHSYNVRYLSSRKNKIFWVFLDLTDERRQ
jgi:hypothetical protein